uniref:Uncharacterized protein n=1 Tax=Picea glauca TaxID=3330 RepID=A0A101M533_PICGL|nr:hypothetical protein ABT39_MTgene1106 [Picea glauca]
MDLISMELCIHLGNYASILNSLPVLDLFYLTLLTCFLGRGALMSSSSPSSIQ